MSEPDPKRIRLSDESRVCQRFSASDADLTLESSDKVLFKVHRNNLATHSTIFPGEDVPSDGEIVKFPEDSQVLELLLQYVYPNVLPNLDNVKFDLLSQLAEAAEKYHIFSAMEICRLHMKRFIPSHPVRVFCYACRYGYNAISDTAAYLTVDKGPFDMLEALGPVHYAHWTLYRERWAKLYSFLATHIIPAKPALRAGHADGCLVSWDVAAEKLIAISGPRFQYSKLNMPDWIFGPIRAVPNMCAKCSSYWTQKTVHFKVEVAKVPTYSQISLPS